eukprot:2761654-Alexandrium_andersonii.AAC.1
MRASSRGCARHFGQTNRSSTRGRFRAAPFMRCSTSTVTLASESVEAERPLTSSARRRGVTRSRSRS